MTTSAYPIHYSAKSASDLVYDPPNSTFFFYLPVVMVAAGLVAWFRPDNTTFLLCTFVGSLAALVCLWDLLMLEGPVKFSRTMAMTLLLGYALGAFNSWYTIPRGTLTLAEIFIQDAAALARAQGAVLFASATLLAIGEIWEKPVFRRDFKLEFDSRVIVFSIISTLITLFAYATKQLSYMGARVDAATHTLGVVPALAAWLITPAFALTVAASIGSRSLASRFMLGALAALDLVCIFPLSRRTLLYSILLAVISTRFAKTRINTSVPRKLLVVALAGGLFYAGNIAFFYVRATTWHDKTALTGSITQLGKATINFSRQTQSSAVLSSLHQNEQTRTFILGYFSDLLNASLRFPPAYGQDLVHQINFALPRAINPGKLDSRYVAEEKIGADVYGLKSGDQANSVLTGGAIDFGIVGAIFYPIILSLLLSLYALVVLKYVRPWVSTVIVLTILLQLLQPEQEFGELFLAARNSTLFAIPLVILAEMPRIHISLKLAR